MNKLKIIFPFLVFAALQGCGKYESAEFWVRGNCEHCEERIESVLGKMPNVQSADYDVDSKIVTVYYDPGKKDLKAWHTAVAAAGHETRDRVADEAAYAKLPDCCKKPEDQVEK